MRSVFSKPVNEILKVDLNYVIIITRRVLDDLQTQDYAMRRANTITQARGQRTDVTEEEQ